MICIFRYLKKICKICNNPFHFYQYHLLLFTFCIFFHVFGSFFEWWSVDPEILNLGLNCDVVQLLLPLLQGIDPLGSRMCFLLCTPTPLEWLARALQDFQPRRGMIWGKGITLKSKAFWVRKDFEVELWTLIERF